MSVLSISCRSGFVGSRCINHILVDQLIPKGKHNYSIRTDHIYRYIICDGLTEFGATELKRYLIAINDKLDELQKSQSIEDVLDVLPIEMLTNEHSLFYKYIRKSNDRFVLSTDDSSICTNSIIFSDLPNVKRNISKNIEYLPKTQIKLTVIRLNSEINVCAIGI